MLAGAGSSTAGADTRAVTSPTSSEAGTLNETEVEFLLDTGATAVAVPETLARAAGLWRFDRRRGKPLPARG